MMRRREGLEQPAVAWCKVGEDLLPRGVDSEWLARAFAPHRDGNATFRCRACLQRTRPHGTVTLERDVRISGNSLSHDGYGGTVSTYGQLHTRGAIASIVLCNLRHVCRGTIIVRPCGQNPSQHAAVSVTQGRHYSLSMSRG